MKKLGYFFLSILVVVLICPTVSLSQIGYTINSSAPYSYANGTTMITSWVCDGLDCEALDDGYVDLPLGDFNFKFYGYAVNTLKISTNGYLTFGTEGMAYWNDPIPYTYLPNAIIAPFWTDLNLTGLTGGRGVWWKLGGTAPYRELIIEWRQVPTYDFGTDSYSFEVILYETTNRIKFQYLNVESETLADKGGWSTVGIENFDGTIGNQFSYNTPSLDNGLAIEFIPKKFEMIDFDGDRKTDIAVYRASIGGWYIIPSLPPGTPYGMGWGGDASDKPVPGDYDGDGKTDIAIYRAGTGAWYVSPSGGGAPYGFGWGGDASDKPAPGDYDGDGKTDIAVYRSGTGAWYVSLSGGGAPYGFGWGGDASDKPAPGDYDGDGKTDIAVYRASTGAWYVSPSGGGAPYGFGWGGDASDKSAQGDYDGDGKTDIAVYRSDTGAWYVSPSGGGAAYGLGWGGDASDKPVPGDYDGDGKTDCAVYRTSTGAWYVYPSGGGAPYGLGWGGDVSDVPLSKNPD